MKCISLAVAALTILGICSRWGRAGDDSAEKKPAVVVVRLPADAELVIGGIKSKQTTPVREFDTPPLTPGKKFSYRIKAVWKDGDKEVMRETTVIVQAGETTEINLREPAPSPPTVSKVSAPELMPKMDMTAAPKPKPEKKVEVKPEPEKKTQAKPEPEKKPQAKPEPEKKPEAKPEPVKKPEVKPERIKKPKPKPSPSSSQLVPAAAPLKTVIEAPAPKGTLALLMPETLTLQAGAAKLLPIKVIRTHCEGAVSIKFEGLPPGIELTDAAVAADKQKVYVRVAAPAEAEEKEWEVKVIGVSGPIRQDAALKIKIVK